MPLTSGDRIGSYEIVARLGAGGMGEVYRARDPKLGREVAIKVLPDTVAGNPERLARFEREARVLASLNHTNIAQIYGLEGHALVMELVEGHTLKAPLPLDTSLNYARQIADALEAAHEKGITHRDLKPANIMVTPGGVIKILDFGLAAVSQDWTSASQDPNAETSTGLATEAGVIMGTVAYMSPEQAAGKPVDKRTDIWSFGVVLAEMLTGERPFAGETLSHTLAAVLAKDPDLTRLPPGLRNVVEKCLRKDPKNRWRDIFDVRMALDESAAPPPPVVRASSRGLQWTVALLLVALAASFWALWRTPQQTAYMPFFQLDLDNGPDTVSQPAISPDGSQVVFVSKGQLILRRFNDNRMTPLSGTEGASFPFFSPDGEWVAFFASGKLKKVALQGGPPVEICAADRARGGTWGEDGYIVASLGGLVGLSRVSDKGGESPVPFTDTKDDPEGMMSHRWPQILPDGKVLFAATSGARGSLRVIDSNKKVRIIVKNSTYGRYLPSGNLIYYQSGALFAAPFDLANLEIKGPAVSLVEGVSYTANVANADFDVSPSGTLVYVRGEGADNVVSWLNSDGTLTPLITKPAVYSFLRLSPDEKKLAVVSSRNIWVYDLDRDAFDQITSKVEGSIGYLTWTPDGKFIIFSMGDKLAWTRSDGSGMVEQLDVGTIQPFPWSLSSDGKLLAFSGPTGMRTISVERTETGLRLGQPSSPIQDGILPALSPEGRFVAYMSSQQQGAQVYVVPFSPDAGRSPRAGKWTISNDGGRWPNWPAGGSEIYYTGPDRTIRVVRYTISGESFIPEKQRVWSSQVLADMGDISAFDMARGGKRAVVLMSPGGGAQKPETHLRVLLNVENELRRRSK